MSTEYRGSGRTGGRCQPNTRVLKRRDGRCPLNTGVCRRKGTSTETNPPRGWTLWTGRDKSRAVKEEKDVPLRELGQRVSSGKSWAGKSPL